MVDLNAYIAVQKFGMGARRDEAQTIGSDAQAWLLAQLTEVSSTLNEYGLMSSQEGVALYYEALAARRIERPTNNASSASINTKQRLGDFLASIDEINREEMLFEDMGVRGSDLKLARNTYLAKPNSESSRPTADKTSQELTQEIIANYFADIGVRTTHAILTPASFREALVRFWSDHFSVFAQKTLLLTSITAAMEREAIRPHVTGKFVEMLIAVQTHPAMLVYLDNWYSIGPNSYAGLNFNFGLNENLAREIFELHTLGVTGGYDQNDIVALAKAITGWTVANPNIQPEHFGKFVFEPLFHEPGTVHIMGKAYVGTGLNQGLEVLADLATHEAAAKFIAGKMARHFHSDTAPQSLIDRLSAAFKDSAGDLEVVSATLITSPEMWDGSFAKLRNSEEFVGLSQIAMSNTF